MTPSPIGPSVRIDVPCDLAAVPGARARVSEAASAWGYKGIVVLDLVVSELVTNAIVHGRTPSVATVRMVFPGSVEVTVSDDGSGSPRIRTTTDVDPTGRGLRIVDALSTSWGVNDQLDDGKTVWARLGSPT